MKNNGYDDYIPFIELLQKIRNNEILTANLKIEDTYGTIWIYNTSKEFTSGDNKIVDYFSPSELLNLYVRILPREIKTNTSEDIAKKEVITEIEDMYEELYQELDACQGCCDNLDIKFAKLRLYKDIVKFLGRDIKQDEQQMVYRFYKKAKENKQIEEEIENHKNDIISTLSLPLNLFCLENETSESILNLYFKVNDICNFLRDNYKLFESYKNKNDKSKI